MNQVPQIFNRKKVLLHRTRAAKNIAEHDFIPNEVAKRLLERLEDLSISPKSALNIGCSSKLLSDALSNTKLTNMDICEELAQHAGGDYIAADEEQLPFTDKSFDLVISNLMLHLINDVPGTLVQIKNILNPDGVFLASFYGGRTLNELRTVMTEAEMEQYGGVSPRISPFADVRSVGQLVQRIGFKEPIVDGDIIKISYDSVTHLMHDLRGMGESCALTKSSKPLNKSLLVRIEELYKEKFSDGEGGVLASFEIINITGLAAK